MNKEETEVFYPKSKSDWRAWLQKNHNSKQAVWVVFYNKASKKPTVSWSDSVDEALCFGWIDSKKIAIDKEKSHQFFSKRKAKGTWSKINKEKILKLTESGMMTQAGLHVIETAKQNGSWTILDEVEELIIPKDLETALNSTENAMDYFLSVSKSVKKMLLSWIVMAKKEETRQHRITEIVTNAAQKQKPKNF
jgi:uncharacterized protein YdeI (YjbR/CyaY-like superfamily)